MEVKGFCYREHKHMEEFLCFGNFRCLRTAIGCDTGAICFFEILLLTVLDIVKSI